MLTELLAVIGGYDEDRGTEQPAPLETSENVLLFGSCRLSNRADSDVIGVANGAHVACRQSDYRLRSSGRSHELNLYAVRFVDLNYRAKIPTAQPVLG